MSVTTTVEPAKIEALAEKVMADFAGGSACYLGALGDALGLFKDLAGNGPATSIELAARAGVAERYVREWLAGVHAAGYVTFDRATGRYELPEHHVPVLAEEAGPIFFGAAFRDVVENGETFQRLVAACRSGGGVPMTAFSDAKRETIARFTAAWFENALVQDWLPKLPDVAAKLEAGASVVDVGCGRGLAVIRLAEAFPRSRFVGMDLDERDVAHATEAARRAGVADRVRFSLHDASARLPGTYDVVTTFDVLHDSTDPAAILRAIHAALEPDGRYVCVDINCEERPEDNVGPLATVKYAASLAYCLTVSLAEGGTGLGTCGLAEPVLWGLARQAGFTGIRRIDTDDPFNCLYELTP